MIPKTDSFQLTDDLQSTTEECSQVIPLLKSPIPDNVDCYSVCAAQHAIDRHVLVKKHPYDLAFALTDYKLQGRTLPKLILSVCHRHRLPWMTLQSFYVLISRVTHMSGLRLLQRDQTGLDNVLTLMPDKYLYAWEQGYDTYGMWNRELVARLYITSEVPETWRSKHLQLRCAKIPSSTTSAVLPKNVRTNTEAPQRKGQH